ncbi:ABC transporter permease [Nibrella saemangeumensis]|uniref:ABC transporter permease n=1 Tax=Nibrella saemangeumensis TaxID=1084526 RepID=A0ABP8MCB4_9BACT
MLRNYLKVAVRSLFKNKVYAFTNIFGLTIGLAAFGLISLYIFDEWRVDRFHEKGNRIYRVLTNTRVKGESGVNSTVGRPLAQKIEAEVPEVDKVVPVRTTNLAITYNNQYFYEKQLFAGEHFLNVFSFPLLEGDPQTALREPYSLVLTQSTAWKYFGGKSALGKVLMLGDTLPFTVTGVLAEPQPSHMDFQVLLSLSTFYATGGDRTPWFTWDETCYVLLPENASPAAAESKISALSMRYNGQEYRNNGYEVTHTLEAVPDIYLHSEAGGLNRATGSARQLQLLGIIGLFILLLACSNFINLTTAHQGERAKEVGIRKTIGAAYYAVVGQFIGESLLLALLSGILALIIVVLMLPLLNDITEKTITVALLRQPVALLVILGFLLFTGVVAGWYPALVLARFRPVDTLKGRLSTTATGTWLRQGLVVFQFSVSLVLIISTLVVSRQLKYMQNQTLGFDKERVLAIELRKTPRRDFIENYESIKQQANALPNVQTVTGTAALPGQSGWEGQLVWVEGRPQDQAVTLEVITVDHDYAKTLGLNIRHGRDYSTAFSTDATSGVLLNETACRAFGWKPEEAVGKKLSTAGLEGGQVIGVLADYHQHGLQEKIKPVLTFIAPYAFRYMALRLGSGDVPASVAQVEQFWKSRFPGYPFEYRFLDEDFDRQYKAEQRLARIFSIFAGLAILIACLGLFGLATFTAERRTKEIGIRKVLGASVPSLISMLSFDFLKLVLVAILVASPIAWYAMSRWLEDFAYRIDMPWWVFVVSGIGALLIAFVTISFQSIKAAFMNPVTSLRAE